MGDNRELLEKLIEERDKKKLLKEKIRKLKKRRKDPLIMLCEEMESKNCEKWKKRRFNEEIVRKKLEEEEKIEIEKIKRLEKAKAKKEAEAKKNVVSINRRHHVDCHSSLGQGTV